MAIILNVNGGYQPALKVGSVGRTAQATPELQPVTGNVPEASGTEVELAASATPKLQPGTNNMPEASVNGDQKIKLTAGSESLRQLETNSNETPVDSERVAKVKKAIADGSYQVDSRRLAGNILKHEKSLFAPG